MMDTEKKPQYCKATVHSNSSGRHGCQCARKAVKDGYCTQHHPDTEKARTAKRMAEYRAKHDKTVKEFKSQLRRNRLAENAEKLIAKCGAMPDPQNYEMGYDAILTWLLKDIEEGE